MNPKASRENLAQFLNHLFLGGQAPPSVDNDVLNKSVVLKARDLNADAEAFAATPVDDLKNRSLSSDFADTAPQTGSHQLLRSARVGDVLTHEAITGEPEPDVLQVVEEYDDLDAVEARLEAAFSVAPDAGALAQPGPIVVASLPGQGSGRAARVFDATGRPTLRSSSDERPEPTEIRTRGPSSSELEVQRQLEEQAQAAEAQAAVQRQMEQQARQAEHDARLQTQLEMQVQMQMEQARLAEAQRQMEAQREAFLQAQRQSQFEEQARQAAMERQLEQQARQQALQAQMAEAQQEALRQRRLPDVMATVELQPVPRRPVSPTLETPSIMLSADLEILSDEATVRNPRAAPAFGAGAAHESLVIDFAAGERSTAEEDQALPLVEGQEQAIRPAARPMGRPVVPSVTAVRPRRASDEGPPTTMPPPTRRR